MSRKLALIGFGEAGRTFATAGNWGGDAGAYDLLVTQGAMRDAMVEAGVTPCADLAGALDGAPLVLSLVTADQAPLAALAAAGAIAPGALYCDMNSVAPQTKQASAQAIEAAGAHYVDVAVMAPVDPARLSVPLLLAGAKAAEAGALLEALGFTNIRIVGDAVGRASSIKMIRSVMVKGMEALTAECALAAQEAGVLDEVLSSLDASERPRPWAERADYNLDRMMIHGERRAAEMEEVVKTLEGLGTGAMMTRGTVQRQRAIGQLGLKQPETGLTHKIEHISRKGGMQTA
ncbi:MAG: DUF1932 domain-containing protein [Sphingobium sp.]